MEQWKTVDGYESYEVSSFGRVRRAVAGNRIKAGGILKACQQGNGYLIVSLYKAFKKKTRLLHLLVARAFVPNPKGLPEVNHKDEKKDNCRSNNLEWRSGLGNKQHSMKLGVRGQGVSLDKKYGKWRASYGQVMLGFFNTRQEALAARRAAVAALPRIE